MLRRLFSRAAALASVLCAFAAWGQAVTVVEYYNTALDAYFITGRTADQTALDAVASFQRTGMTFQATAAASATASQTKICRFYIHSASPYVSSHFYGRQGVDCESIRAQNLVGFDWEDYDFATQQPTAGVCPAGTVGIYRGFKAAAGGKTSNHRYSASLATYNTAVTAGYVGESIAFCATAATAATAVVTPPSSGSGDCGTYYYLGKRVTYQSSSSAGGGISSYVRTYDATPTAFNGQTATHQVVDTSPDGTKSLTMIQDGASSWTELGGRSTGSSGVQETYFTPPIVYPKVMAIGQAINFTRAVAFNPATPTGTGTQTGSIVLTSRESVTAPAGTFANACKFTIHTVTTYPIGSSSTTNSVVWVVPGVGYVRAEINDSTTVFGFSVNSSAVVVATAIQ